MKPSPLPPRSCSLFSSLALALALFWSPPAQAGESSAAGHWKWTFETPNGQSLESSLLLKQEGGKLTGTYKSSRGVETAIEDGRIEGDKVFFQITRQRNDRTLVMKYEGKLEKDQIKGTATIGGGDRSFEWLAKREVSHADPSGTWNWSMMRQDGQRMEATLILKAAGEKLTGSIAGGELHFELEHGLIKGNEISFTTSRERDGQLFVAKSKGKISGDSIKGTVEFTMNGETRTREWEAKKQ